MKIGGLQKLTLLDYPGKTACTVFLPGCNFRCPFCHNASLVVPEKLDEGIEEEELFRFLKKRQGLLEGVCITGGEPLLREEIYPLLETIKDCGYQVKLDTNGSFPERVKKAVEAGLVDYVAMDLKNSPAHYKKTIGFETSKAAANTAEIAQSVQYLLKGKVDYEFRTTVVKGLHTVKDMEEIGNWIAGAKRYYIQNFVDSGDLVGSGEWMEPFSKKELSKLLNAVRSKVPNSWIRGE